MKEIMLFQAGQEQFGLDLSWVKGVYRAADLAECTEGADLSAETVRPCRLPDGTEMPLYDFPIIFGRMPTGRGGVAGSSYRKVIRMEVETVPLAVLADHIDRVVETEADQIVALPLVFGEKSRKWFPGILLTDTRLIPLLDPAGMAGIVPRSGESGEEEIFSRLIREEAVEKHILSVIHRETVRIMHMELPGMAEKISKAVRH